MKKAVFYFLAIAIVAVTGFLPFSGTDVAKLQPVEVLILQRANDLYTISTNDGLSGVGKDTKDALMDLKLAAPGEVFLETANYLLVAPDCLEVIAELYSYLRPACQLYLMEGEGSYKLIAKYLESHPSEITLLSFRQGRTEIPHLMLQGEVYRLVK